MFCTRPQGLGGSWWCRTLAGQVWRAKVSMKNSWENVAQKELPWSINDRCSQKLEKILCDSALEVASSAYHIKSSHKNRWSKKVRKIHQHAIWEGIISCLRLPISQVSPGLGWALFTSHANGTHPGPSQCPKNLSYEDVEQKLEFRFTKFY